MPQRNQQKPLFSGRWAVAVIVNPHSPWQCDLRETSFVFSKNPGQNGSIVQLGLTFINPLKHKWRLVACSKPKEEKLVKKWGRVRSYPGLRVCRFLNRVLVFATVGRPGLILLMGDLPVGVIYAHYSNTDWIPASSSKMFYLPR